MTTPIILNVVICHYQTFVACTTVNKAFYSMFTEFYIQSPDSYLVQVAVKNMLVLRWNQRAHYWFLGRPKGHIRGPPPPPKGTVPFGKGLAQDPALHETTYNQECREEPVMKRHAPPAHDEPFVPPS